MSPLRPPFPETVTSGATTRATRYVDMGGDCWKVTTPPPPGDARGGMLERAVYSGGTPCTVMLNRALYAGSSKQGKASRADVASN